MSCPSGRGWVWSNGKTILVSKDGSNAPVQNFALEQLAGGFKTNVGTYFEKPAYTMLIPVSVAESWVTLIQEFSGSLS